MVIENTLSTKTIIQQSSGQTIFLLATFTMNSKQALTFIHHLLLAFDLFFAS